MKLKRVLYRELHVEEHNRKWGQKGEQVKILRNLSVVPAGDGGYPCGVHEDVSQEEISIVKEVLRLTDLGCIVKNYQSSSSGTTPSSS